MNRLTQLKSLRAQKLVKPGLKQNEVCTACWGWRLMGYTYNLSGITRYFESEGPCYRCDNDKFLSWQKEKKALNVDCMNSFRGSPPVQRQPLDAPSIAGMIEAMRLDSAPPLVSNVNVTPEDTPGYGWTIHYTSGAMTLNPPV